MKYITPEKVLSPRDAISNLKVLHDGGPQSVSIARLTWFGKPVFAMRWNVSLREWNDPNKIAQKKLCLGMPVTRGYPTWFILPDHLIDCNSSISREIQEIIKVEIANTEEK